ncbi:hypothetical protein E4U44_002793 [Claviceps purpurea]|nr:hypothetical protein E4U37_004508 [Claviceps purpurea]KAG6313151.1 hypothetical protein E4U44_002793 [Claviceps purpurea]
MSRIVVAAIVAGLALPATQAILCPAASNCSFHCGNVLDKTSPDDLVCDQRAFSSDPTGQVFAGCVDCQRWSTFHAANNSDAQSMLYNLRYAVSYCLWGKTPTKNPKVVDTPCITTKACGPFRDAVEYQNLSSKYDAYEYCDLWPTSDTLDFQGCTDCLQAEGRPYIANFVIALQAGCQQKPSPGLFIGLDGEIFSPTAIRISAPSPTAFVDPAWFDQGPLTVGAKVGIAAGCLVVVLILMGCAIVCNGKRRRKAYLRSIEPRMTNVHTPNINTDNKITINTALGWPSSVSQPPIQGYDDSPLSQRPLREWHNSPLTTQSDTSFSRHFSPYSSQYNSPISAQEAALIQWPPVALTPNQPIGAAVTAGDDPVHTWGSPVDAKGKSREEAYEMHMVDNRGNGNV